MILQKNIEIIEFSDISFSRKTQLGKGGAGRVYLGKYLSSEVAIKEYYTYNLYDDFENEDTKDLLVEIVNALSLNIPKVNRCYGVSINEKEGLVYTVHELAFGNLKKKLQEKLPIETKHEITKQILEIMMHLYKKKIVHRDIKPENFLITKNGEVQIADFGTIRKMQNNETKTLNAAYTVRYAPPEFILGTNFAGFYSDVWSIGLVLFQIYYGVDFWKGYAEKDIEESIKGKKIPSFEYCKDVPKEITDIIKEAVVLDEKARISIVEIQKRFEKIINKK